MKRYLLILLGLLLIVSCSKDNEDSENIIDNNKDYVVEKTETGHNIILYFQDDGITVEKDGRRYYKATFRELKKIEELKKNIDPDTKEFDFHKSDIVFEYYTIENKKPKKDELKKLNLYLRESYYSKRNNDYVMPKYGWEYICYVLYQLENSGINLNAGEITIRTPQHREFYKLDYIIQAKSY